MKSIKNRLFSFTLVIFIWYDLKFDKNANQISAKESNKYFSTALLIGLIDSMSES